MGFVTVYSKATGRKRRVPEHYLDQPRLMAGFALTPSERARRDAENPGGEPPAITEPVAPMPDESWTRADIDAFAADHGITTSSASSKADALAVIETALTTQTSDGTESSDETPATGGQE